MGLAIYLSEERKEMKKIAAILIVALTIIVILSRSEIKSLRKELAGMQSAAHAQVRNDGQNKFANEKPQASHRTKPSQKTAVPKSASGSGATDPSTEQQTTAVPPTMKLSEGDEKLPRTIFLEKDLRLTLESCSLSDSHRISCSGTIVNQGKFPINPNIDARVVDDPGGYGYFCQVNLGRSRFNHFPLQQNIPVHIDLATGPAEHVADDAARANVIVSRFGGQEAIFHNVSLGR